MPEADLKDWLANPDFTPYPGDGAGPADSWAKLKAPVFIDVIAFNYENSPVWSHRAS